MLCPFFGSAEAGVFGLSLNRRTMLVLKSGSMPADHPNVLMTRYLRANVLNMRRLAMRFNGILRGRKADPLPAWIDDTIETHLVPIVRFARTLNRNTDAVRNAIEMEWSNGQAEGQINRLKTLKRAMCGRADPNLLGTRMLLCTTQIEDDPL